MVRRLSRAALYLALVVLVGLAVLVGILLFFTRTRGGIERAGRFAVSRLAEQVQGEMRVGRVRSSGLLHGATLYDVSIRDRRGRPFLLADSASIAYNWRTLLGGSIVLDRVTIWDARVIVEKLPGDTAWNYQTIFADTTPDEGPRRLVLLRDARLVNADVRVRYPWRPESPPDEPSDTARLVLESEQGQPMRVLRFQVENASIPRIVWSTPEEPGQLIRIASLRGRAYIWETPVVVEEAAGNLALRDSVIAFDVPRFRLPGSAGRAIGTITRGKERRLYDILVEGRDVDFSDLQWLYPRLPEQGGGTLTLQIQSLDRGTLWLISDALVRTPGSELAGSFGVVTGDTLYFTNVDLRASPLDLALLRAVLPGDLPLEGIMVGTVEVEGPISALQTRGTVTVVRRGTAGPPSGVRWRGTLDLRRFRFARNMTADVRDLDLALLAALRPNLRLAGAVTGRLEAAAQRDGSIRFAASVQHRVGDGPASTLEGAGSFSARADRPALDLRVDAHPLAFAALADAIPGFAELTGDARGPITITGALDDLHLDADLETSAGRLAVRGRFDLLAEAPSYEVEGSVTSFHLENVVPRLPPLALTASFAAAGAGRGAAATRATGRLDIVYGSIGPVDLRGGSLRLAVDDGLLRVDSLEVRTEAGTITAGGEIGLIAARSGTLRLAARGDSLTALRPVFFPDDAALTDEARPGLGGRLAFDATAEGSLAAGFGLRGTLRLDDALFARTRADAAGLDFDAGGLRIDSTGLRTDSLRLRLAAHGDSVRFGRQLLYRIDAGLQYAAPAGSLHASAGGPGGRAYRLRGQLEHFAEGLRIELAELGIDVGTGHWSLAGPARLTASAHHLDIADFRLVAAGDTGVIDATGRLAWGDVPMPPATMASADPAARVPLAGIPLPGDSLTVPAPPPDTLAFRLSLRRVAIGDFLSIVQEEAAAHGQLDGSVEVSGTSRSPRINAELSLDEVASGDVRLDRVETRFDYSDQLLLARFTARRAGRPVLAGEGRIPLDLGFRAMDERRLARPLGFSIWADGLPAAVVTAAIGGFRDVRGTVDGTIVVGGTARDPEPTGTLTLAGGTATFIPLGVRYRDVSGTFRLRGRQVVEVDATLRTGENGGLRAGGRATVTGTIGFAALRDPTFDLRVAATGFEAAHRRDVDLVTSGEARLLGSYNRPEIRVALRVDRGALYLDEFMRQYEVVDLGGPLLFDVVDTTVVAIHKILPSSQNPFLRNLRVTGEIDVTGDTWLRGANMNIELSGSLAAEYDRLEKDLLLTGTLRAVRGTYQLRAARITRRFEVERGTITFAGTPGIDPNLDITAVYRTRAGDDPLQIRAIVTGTMLAPRVRLTSDAQPPISESDLASYLFFGRPTNDLAPSESRSLAGIAESTVAPSLFGFLAGQLETVASDMGLLDYIAITSAESDRNAEMEGVRSRVFGLLTGTQIEVGRYLSDDLFVVASQRIGLQRAQQPAVRLEWRFHPTWTAELFAEDRFSRNYLLDLGLEYQRIYGFSLFREWGY